MVISHLWLWWENLIRLFAANPKNSVGLLRCPFQCNFVCSSKVRDKRPFFAKYYLRDIFWTPFQETSFKMGWKGKQLVESVACPFGDAGRGDGGKNWGGIIWIQADATPPTLCSGPTNWFNEIFFTGTFGISLNPSVFFFFILPTTPPPPSSPEKASQLAVALIWCSISTWQRLKSTPTKEFPSRRLVLVAQLPDRQLMQNSDMYFLLEYQSII